MTHTPGKWIIHGPSENLEYSEGGDYAILADNQMLIADVIHTHGLGDPEANARLIAAAPEMLEALKAILKWARCHALEMKVDEDFVNAMDIIQDVVEKAEGNREPG